MLGSSLDGPFGARLSEYRVHFRVAVVRARGGGTFDSSFCYPNSWFTGAAACNGQSANADEAFVSAVVITHSRVRCPLTRSRRAQHENPVGTAMLCSYDASVSPPSVALYEPSDVA